MPLDQTNAALPLIGRAAEITPASLNREAMTIDIIWTTGAIVQRHRWEGWDDVVEYDEELVVSPEAIRLERMNSGAPFLNSHYAYDLSSVLGSIVPGSVRIEGGQGRATVKLTTASDAEGIVHRILEGTVRSVSVGYRVHKYEITKEDGQREKWRAVDWEPFEVSAVAMPADAGAHIRSGAAPAQVQTHQCVLVRTTATAAPAAHSRGTEMDPELNPAGGVTTPAPSAADAVAAERQRGRDLSDLCQRHGMDREFETDLISRGVTVDAARTAILERLAAQNPARVSAPAQARDAGTTEIAYRDAMSLALQHRHDPARNVLSDDAREFRGMNLIDLARHALERRGVTTRGMSRMEIAEQAFQMRSAGMHSTSDFPTILGNVAGRTLRMAYDTTPRTFTAWARRATITDFKPVTRAQLGGAPSLTKVSESGEIKYGTMGEAKEVYALASYGKIIALTRQTLLNDDLDAFTRVPAAFGAAAADLESDLVYNVLLNNGVMDDGVALFHATHKNLLTASVIDEAAISALYRAFATQTGLEGRKINLAPQFLIVPPGTRAVQARKMIAATTPNSTADVNPFAGRMQVIEESRLIPPTGADPWFAAADPNRIDTVEFAYLEGQEGVRIETRAGFEREGMEIKAVSDFAAAAIDFRGLAKNAGA